MHKFRFVYLPKAYEDINRIYDDLAYGKSAPTAAKATMMRLAAAANEIQEAPRACDIVGKESILHKWSIRIKVVDDLSILYIIHAADWIIEIVRVRYGRMDFEHMEIKP